MGSADRRVDPTPSDKADLILALDLAGRLRRHAAEMRDLAVALYCPLLLDAAAAELERLTQKAGREGADADPA